jgi:ribosomal protein L25 (general stress protein Ctc)
LATVKLMAYRRAKKGNDAARRLRREGKLPAMLYNRDTEETISVDAQAFKAILKSEAAKNPLIDLFINADPPKRYHVRLRDVQTDAVSLAPLYAGFDCISQG